jgi:Zn-dependent protease with chaperone function
MDNTIEYYRTVKEKTYHLMLCIFGGMMWLGLASFFIAADSQTMAAFAPLLFYVFLFLIFILFSALAFRARAMGNMILVSEKQLPELFEIVLTGAQKIGLKTPPETFLYNSNGLLNAFARGIFGKKYLLLTSAIVEIHDQKQLQFIIGHELGHHAAGHLDGFLNLLKFPAKIIPFLNSAYSRECEFTCDRIGYHLSRDIESASSAIQMLACGCKKMNGKIDAESFEFQEQLVPPFFGFLTEVFKSHPRLTRRVIALKEVRLLN